MITQHDQTRIYDNTMDIADYLAEIKRRNILQHNISEQLARICKLNDEIYRISGSDWNTP